MAINLGRLEQKLSINDIGRLNSILVTNIIECLNFFVIIWII